jgi:hypothetical protein
VALDLPRPWATAVPAATSPVAVSVAEVPVVTAVTTDAEAEGAPIPTATLAEIYIKQGLVDQAVKVYEEILRLEPANAAVLERLAALRPPAPTAPPVETISDAVPEITAPPDRSPPREPLAVFEGWLQAIALRRAHVQ